MKKILILGGTAFVGRILTEELIKAGETPVLFNRGKRNPGIFPELRKITGERNSDDIKQIANESWDVVIDFSCMFPDNLDEITEMLKGKAGRYIFISTVSVFPMDNPDEWKHAKTEDDATLSCTPEQRVNPDVMATYGEKKAECERVLLSKDMDSVIFRPSLIYGRFDYTDRFYYWLYKCKTQNKILLPHGGQDRFTATYSEDFAGMIKSAIFAEKHNKVYNASTHKPVSIWEYLDLTCRLLNTIPDFVSALPDFLEENKVTPWQDLPLWLGGMDMMVDNSKAVKDFNLKMQSFEDSLKGCIEYYTSLGWKPPVTGLAAEKEQELIKKLKSA